MSLMKEVQSQEVLQTEIFSKWLAGLRDRNARAKIVVAIEGLERGNFGNSAPVGEGVSELKLNFGPGYRLYYMKYGTQVLLLLCGGDKSSQKKDVKSAHDLKKEVEQDG